MVKEAKTPDPIVLIHDYHFALAPAMIRRQLPDATIITFWHIPWPNFESFSICPWKEEILEGMLGSDILGFHTSYHCKNFIETVDRFLEARIEHETATISIGGSLTHVHAYPISVAWPEPIDRAAYPALRRRMREKHGLPPEHRLAIGVDRLDYTKGIVERIRSVERMLEMHPEWIGNFTMIQVAAPTRSSLPEYKRFEAEVRQAADEVNQRFGTSGQPPPILLLIEHHGIEAVLEYFRAADICMVTSLHDGMNLVSKEFVAAHDDERGVLILSQFAGASRELLDALIVNPYHIDQVADALLRGAQHARARAGGAHAQPAPAGARVQRLSLGRPDAAGRRQAAAPDPGGGPHQPGRQRRRPAAESRPRAAPAGLMIDLQSAAGDGLLLDALRRQPLLALDFDGTLAPIVPRPADAAMDRGCRRCWSRSRAGCRWRSSPVVALEDLAARVPVDGLVLIGNHGNEWGADVDAGAADAAQAAGDGDRAVERRARQRQVVLDWAAVLAAPLACHGPRHRVRAEVGLAVDPLPADARSGARAARVARPGRRRCGPSRRSSTASSC